MTKKEMDAVAAALVRVLETPNEVDSNFENCNVVDAICRHSRSVAKLAEAIEHLAVAQGYKAPSR